MKLLKLLVVLILLAALVLFVLPRFSDRIPFLSKLQLPAALSQYQSMLPASITIPKTDNLPTLPSDTNQQIEILSSRARSVSEQAGTVLGESIKVDESQDKAVHEKAFEYGRYLYCKEVVKEYEQQKE